MFYTFLYICGVGMSEINNLMKARLNKLENLKNMGIIPYAEKFVDWVYISKVKEEFDDKLDKEEKSGEKRRVKGRVMTIRHIGKLAFIKLRDVSGDIQLFFFRFFYHFNLRIELI